MELSDARRTLAAGLLVALGCLAPACRGGKTKPPSSEQVTELLRQQAAALKAGGENLDPRLRVKATWNIKELKVQPQPGNKEQPWAGTILFLIRSETKDADGSVIRDQFERRFEFVWSPILGRWIVQPKPAR